MAARAPLWMKWPRSILLRALLPVLLVPIAQRGTAQYPGDISALRALARNAPHDTTRAQALLFLAVRLCDTWPDSVKPLCTASMRIADSLLLSGLVQKSAERQAYHRIKATGLLNMGHYFRARSEPARARGRYSDAADRYRQAGFASGERDAWTAMASLLEEQGATAESVELARKAEALRGQGTDMPYGAIPWDRFAPATAKRKTPPAKQRSAQGQVDSLRALIRSAKHDTTRAQAMLFLAVLLQQTRMDSAQFFCKESLRIAKSRLLPGVTSTKREKAAYRRIKATALLNVGLYTYDLEQYVCARTEFQDADFPLGEADALTAISGMLRTRGHTEQGILISWDEYYDIQLMDNDLDAHMVTEGRYRYLSNDYPGLLDKKAAALYRKAPRIAYGSMGFDPNAPKRGRAAGPAPGTEARVNMQKPVPASVPVTPPQDDQDTRTEEVVPTAYGWKLVDPDDPGQEIPISPVDSATVTVERIALPPLAIDTAAIARHRAHLSRPVRTDGGPGAARDHLEQGEALVFVREPELAMASFEQARSIYHVLRSDSGECAALLRIGKLQGEQGGYAEAYSTLDQARKKAHTIGRMDMEGLALASMADVCQHIDTCGEAAGLYRRSIDLAHAASDKHTEARGYIGITGDLVKKGSFAEAEPLGQQGLGMATDVDDADLRLHGASLLEQIHARLGHGPEALEMSELVLALDAWISDRNVISDSIISAMRAEIGALRTGLFRAHAQDSIAHHHERTALQEDLSGAKAKATRNRIIAIAITLCALAAIIGGLLYYRHDRKRRQQRADRNAAELEIKALRAQMNPHFLFNALNSINDHIQQSDTEVASDFLVRFSRLMRQVLDMSRLNEVSLQHEIDVILLYAELERMRLKDRFTVAVSISPEVDPEAVLVPPMILQPFVENAIWHGLSRKEGPGHLWILAGITDGSLRIAVEDDGVGRSASAGTVPNGRSKDHTSLGTTITKERLDLWGAQHHAPAGFSYVPAHSGTRVELVLPVVSA